MAVSTAELVREYVAATPVGGFVSSRELHARVGSRKGIDAALHRLVETEPLRPVRRGLYFKGERTRFGVSSPDPLSVGMEVVRLCGASAGAGPTGVSAARVLGLTTQVPAVAELAVCGRPPAPVNGVRFASRSSKARSNLRPLDVAVLEVLRFWPRYSEKSWLDFVNAVADLAQRDLVAPLEVQTAAAKERHRRPQRWAATLVADLALPDILSQGPSLLSPTTHTTR